MSMTLETAAVRMACGLVAFEELSDGKTLVLQLEDRLSVVGRDELLRAASEKEVQLEHLRSTWTFLEGLEAGEDWALAGDGYVWVAREGVLTAHFAGRGRPSREIRVAELPAGAFGLALDARGESAVVVTVRELDPCFDEYALTYVDLTQGAAREVAGIGTMAELELLYAENLGCFLAYEPEEARLWSCSEGTARLLDASGEPCESVTLTESSAGVAACRFSTSADGPQTLAVGTVGENTVSWASPVTFEDDDRARHSARPDRGGRLLACLASGDADERIEMRDARGRLLAATALPGGFAPGGLRWSRTDPSRLYAIDDVGLVVCVAAQSG